MPAVDLHWYDGGIEPERPDLLPEKESCLLYTSDAADEAQV